MDIKQELELFHDLEMESKQIERLLAEVRANIKRGFTCAATYELEKIYVRYLEEFRQNKQNCFNYVNMLEDTEKELCKLRYIDGLTWEQIAEKMCYSYTQVHRIHKKMIATLTKKVEG